MTRLRSDRLSWGLRTIWVGCFSFAVMQTQWACSQSNDSQSNQAVVSSGQHIVVVLDDSGSMNENMRRDRRVTKIRAAKQALSVVLDALPADAQVGVVLLNAKRDGNHWIVPLGPIDKNQAQKAINSVRAGGSTPLGQFMKIGADALLQAREVDHYGNYRLLIVTDGEANDKPRVEQYLPDILARGVTTDVIGVDMGAKHSLATKVHTYRRADDPNSLTQAVREVFAETSAAAGDAGESDFELVAALPDEVATAALAALAAGGNHPIGTSTTALGNDHGPAANVGQNRSHNGGSNQQHTPQPGPRRKKGLNPFVFFIIAVVVFSVLKAVFRGGGKA